MAVITSIQNLHSHHGPKCIFHLSSTVQLWAGSASEVTYRPWDLQITFQDSGYDHYAPTPTITANGLARKLLPKELFRMRRDTPSVVIDWPDFSTPDLSREWWQLLVDSLSKLTPVPGAGLDDFQVGICCSGGHGRTGTALAIIGSLAGLIPPLDDPVEWVRDHYCDRVVETGTQVSYITAVTGRKVSVQPASFFSSVGQNQNSAAASAKVFEGVLKKQLFKQKWNEQTNSWEMTYEGDEKEAPDYSAAGYGDDDEGFDDDGNLYVKNSDGRIIMIPKNEQKWDQQVAWDLIKEGWKYDISLGAWRAPAIPIQSEETTLPGAGG